MLLFILLESGVLDAKRGDVVVFNNTSAEHPNTYQFVASCKSVVEKKYGIPFFWIERCTYEDARGGKYTRIPSFRLVNSEPYSPSNPDGYHWRGEVFEELLSWAGYVPSIHQRTCTSSLKLEATRDFLREWFSTSESTIRQGHYGTDTRLDMDDLYERHLKSGGSVPRKAFDRKKEFCFSRPVARESQQWSDYSAAWVPFQSRYLNPRSYEDSVQLGRGRG